MYLALPGLSCGICHLSCGMRDLVPSLGIEPRPPALGVQSLNHWTTKEVPESFRFLNKLYHIPLSQIPGNSSNRNHSFCCQVQV